MTLTDTPIDFLITRPPAEGSPLRGFPRPACGSDSVGWPANGAGISPSRLREPDPGEPRYSGLFVLVEGPEKKAADALARIPEYLVVVGERVLGYKGTADAEAEVLRVVENGTTAADIAVYRRRPVEVETAFEVRIESVEEDGDRVTAGKRRCCVARPQTALVA
jgi:hypothetical protein